MWIEFTVKLESLQTEHVVQECLVRIRDPYRSIYHFPLPLCQALLPSAQLSAVSPKMTTRSRLSQQTDFRSLITGRGSRLLPSTLMVPCSTRVRARAFECGRETSCRD